MKEHQHTAQRVSAQPMGGGPNGVALAPPGGGIVQRVVEQFKAGGQPLWRSSFDNKTQFLTKLEAENHETAILNSGNINMGKLTDRSATAFTMFQTPMNQTIGTGGSTQGPHTVAEVGINKAIQDSNGPQLQSIFNALPQPNDAVKIVKDEKDELKHDLEFNQKITRYQSRYEGLHKAFANPKIKKKIAKQRIVLKHLVNLDPHGTYAYNKTNPKGLANWHALIKGKGEKANAPVKKLIDNNGKAFFKDKKRYEMAIKRRSQILANRQ